MAFAVVSPDPCTAMARQTARYVHALRYRWLKPLYDPLEQEMLRESASRGRIMRQSRIRAGRGQRRCAARFAPWRSGVRVLRLPLRSTA